MEIISSVTCQASHSKSTVCARYNSDGTLLATTGPIIEKSRPDRRVIIHRIENGEAEKIVEGNHTAGVSQVFWLSDQYIGAASDDGMIKIRDIEADKNVRTFQLSKQRCPTTVDVNPFNHAIVVGDTVGSVSMFHVNHATAFSPFEAQGKGVVSVQFNQSGEEMLTAGLDGIIRQWVAYEKPVCVASLIPCPKLFTTLSCASYSENDKYIVASTLDSTHRLFRVMDHQQAPFGFMKGNPLERQFSGHVNTRYMSSSMLAFHEERGYVISGSDDGKLHVWDADSEELVLSAQAHTGPLFSLARNPNHDRLEVASCGGDGQVKIWTLSPTGQSNGALKLEQAINDGEMVVDESS